MKLKGKIIVITGASSGVGEQLAVQAAKLGGIPVLLARTEERLHTLQCKLEKEYRTSCYSYKLDVTKEEQVQDVFDRIAKEVGYIDVLVNNAGFGKFLSFEDASLDEVKAMFDVNVFGVVACIKAVLPAMVERNSGHIINIASMAGKIATPKSSAYAATKHAIIGLSNSLRMELAATNIKVTVVNPGPIHTNFFKIADRSGKYEESVQRILLKPEYVAAEILKTIWKYKRELQLPRWMGIGPVAFALFPRTFEVIAGAALRKK